MWCLLESVVENMDYRNQRGQLIDDLMQRIGKHSEPYLNVWWQAPNEGNCAPRPQPIAVKRGRRKVYGQRLE